MMTTSGKKMISKMKGECDEEEEEEKFHRTTDKGKKKGEKLNFKKKGDFHKAMGL